MLIIIIEVNLIYILIENNWWFKVLLIYNTTTLTDISCWLHLRSRSSWSYSPVLASLSDWSQLNQKLCFSRQMSRTCDTRRNRPRSRRSSTKSRRISEPATPLGRTGLIRSWGCLLQLLRPQSLSETIHPSEWRSRGYRELFRSCVHCQSKSARGKCLRFLTRGTETGYPCRGFSPRAPHARGFLA